MEETEEEPTGVTVKLPKVEVRLSAEVGAGAKGTPPPKSKRKKEKKQ
jgi:hypothetical protein